MAGGRVDAAPHLGLDLAWVARSNSVASTLPMATARPRATSMNRSSWSTWSVGSACWSRSKEMVANPHAIRSS